MSDNLRVVSERGKGTKQEVQSVMVMKEGNEWLFNFSTNMDPRPGDMEYLKIFRNSFVDELKKLNDVFGGMPGRDNEIK